MPGVLVAQCLQRLQLRLSLPQPPQGAAEALSLGASAGNPVQQCHLRAGVPEPQQPPQHVSQSSQACMMRGSIKLACYASAEGIS